METTDAAQDRSSDHADSAASNETDALLDQPDSSMVAHSSNKQLLIYALPALLLW